MLVELLGLPGSGKSTLVKTLLEKSSDHPINIETLNQRAERVLQHHKCKRGYIRRKRGRGWFFATFEFAHCYPEIFRIVFENAILQQDRNLDFFDLLAQYHFSKQATDAVGPALSDEGFLHRGSAIFLYPNTYSNIDSRRSCRAIMSDPMKKSRRRCTVTFGSTTNNFRSQRCVAGRPCKR